MVITTLSLSRVRCCNFARKEKNDVVCEKTFGTTLLYYCVALLAVGTAGSRFFSSIQSYLENDTGLSRGQDIQPGMTVLRHSWRSNPTFHPHLHCIVPTGGLNRWGKWQEFANAHNRSPFLLSTRAMSLVFRAKYIAEILGEMQILQNVRKLLPPGSYQQFQN